MMAVLWHVHALVSGMLIIHAQSCVNPIILIHIDCSSFSLSCWPVFKLVHGQLFLPKLSENAKWMPKNCSLVCWRHSSKISSCSHPWSFRWVYYCQGLQTWCKFINEKNIKRSRMKEKAHTPLIFGVICMLSSFNSPSPLLTLKWISGFLSAFLSVWDPWTTWHIHITVYSKTMIWKRINNLINLGLITVNGFIIVNKYVLKNFCIMSVFYFFYRFWKKPLLTTRLSMESRQPPPPDSSSSSADEVYILIYLSFRLSTCTCNHTPPPLKTK